MDERTILLQDVTFLIIETITKRRRSWPRPTPKDYASLLTTLKKGSLSSGNHYEDTFLAPDRMQWQSQTQTRRDSQIGRMLSGAERDARIHLFVRNGKLRNGKAAPFLYCGQPVFEGWEGEKPITVTWRLRAPVPEHLGSTLGIT